MPSPAPDPYRTLGVAVTATDAELRTAYRRLVMAHHPDHNAGSPESSVRFAEVQEAYAHVRLLRRAAARASAGATDDATEARIAQMEAELAEARAQRERAERAARHAPRPDAPSRPSDEELGYVSTNDSFTKILDDFADHVADEVSDRVADAARPTPRAGRPARPRSVTDWIDELGSRLTGEGR